MIDPAEMDKCHVQFLRQTCGIDIVRQEIPNTLGSQMVARSNSTRLDMPKAMNRTRQMLKPATETELREALASLRSSTRRRRRAEDEIDTKLDRFETKLRAYPSDIALHVLATWDDDHEEFPAAWAELHDECEKRFAFRRQILPALQSFDPNQKQADTRSAEEIAADSQGVRAKYLETMQRLGRKPRGDLLPDGVIVENYAPPPKPPNEKGIGARMMDERREAERAGLARELHPDFPIYAEDEHDAVTMGPGHVIT